MKPTLSFEINQIFSIDAQFWSFLVVNMGEKI